jgi:predicted amidohydrolase
MSAETLGLGQVKEEEVEIRVAGAQLAVTLDVASNVAAIVRAIDYAAGEEADILLTPEGSLSGYTHQFDPQEVQEGLRLVLEAARAAGVGLALGTCFVEADDGQCYNQIRFYGPRGTFLGCHTKTLRCGTVTGPPEGEIDHYAVRPLRTYTFKGVQIGALICNDLWANPECTPMPDPHLSQQLSRMGAQVIFHAVNGGRDGSEWSEIAWQYHNANLRMRARAGKLWIVTVDSAYPLALRCSAPSGVLDRRGEWVCHAPVQGEHFFVQTIDLSR